MDRAPDPQLTFGNLHSGLLTVFLLFLDTMSVSYASVEFDILLPQPPVELG